MILTNNIVAPLIKKASQRVIISYFDLTEANIKFIFENTTAWQNVTLWNWRIGRLSVGFEINPNLEYSIHTLDLYSTVREKGRDYMKPEKLFRFLDALRNTPMVDTLSLVHIDSSHNPTNGLYWIRSGYDGYIKPRWIEEWFETYGFDVTILVDWFRPIIL